MNAEKALRRLRAAASIASLWSVAWLAVGAALGVVVPLEGGSATVRLTLASMQLWGMWGACAGLVYASCLALEHVHSIRQLTSRRALMWGALSGLVLPIGLRLGSAVVAPQPIRTSLIAIILGFGAVGAICGIGTLVLARRADSPDSPAISRPTPTGAISSGPSHFARGVQRVRAVVRPWFRRLNASQIRISHASLVT